MSERAVWHMTKGVWTRRARPWALRIETRGNHSGPGDHWVALLTGQGVCMSSPPLGEAGEDTALIRAAADRWMLEVTDGLAVMRAEVAP
jgi:hypothetical protein